VNASLAASGNLSMPDVPRLTADGRALLVDRLRAIRERVLPMLRPLLTAPDRDERDVLTFERTVAEEEFLDRLLAVAAPVRADSFDGRIQIGCRVTIKDTTGDTEVVRVVDPVEAHLDDERISATSPLGRALMGVRAGDTVTIEAPRGTWKAKVVDVVAVA
jgi:transcription elongation factor GreA